MIGLAGLALTVALILGGVGLFVLDLRWLLILAVVFLAAAAILGFSRKEA